NPVAPVETPIEEMLTSDEPPEDSTPRESSEQEKRAGADNATRMRERTVMAIEDTADEGDGEAEYLDDLPDDVIVFSAREVLRKKDFSQFSAEEIAEARRMIAKMDWRPRQRDTRATERGRHTAS